MNIKCFLCEEDLTNKTKVLSYFNFPHKAWNEAQKDWVSNFKELFNGVMCNKCAAKDLDVAHLKQTQGRAIEEAKIPLKKQLERFHKLFGTFYIRF